MECRKIASRFSTSSGTPPGSSRSGTKQECSPLTFGPIGTGPPSAAGKVSGLRLVFLYRIGNVVKGPLGARERRVCHEEIVGSRRPRRRVLARCGLWAGCGPGTTESAHREQGTRRQGREHDRSRPGFLRLPASPADDHLRARGGGGVS